MKKILFVIVLVLFAIIKAQKNYNIKVVPPSPNVSNLLANIEVPVAYETGVADIAIPIYKVAINNEFELPISLNYQASGIKVNQESSPVGLGWNLQAGGVISATIVGESDIQKRITNTPEFPSSMTGLISSELIKKLTSNSTGYIEKDLQPDIFYYSCPNWSGKFMLKENGTPVLFPLKNLRFERYNGTGWKMTDDKGIIYIFNDIEITDSESNTLANDYTGVEASSGVNFNSNVSSYYLSEIILTTGKKIQFNYIDESYIINQSPQKTQTFKINTYNISTEYIGDKITKNKNIIKGKLLSSIIWDEGQAIFESNQRKDLIPLSASEKLPQKINKILIYNKGALIKSFVLDFDYFNKCQLLGCEDDTNSIRLKLLSIKECGINQACNPPYEFKYNTTNNLPNKYLGSRDHWGYINNLQDYDNVPGFINATEFFDSEINNSEKFFFYDNVIILNGGSRPFYKYIDYRKRESSSTNMSLGSLIEIKYPTKGYTKLEYEANKYSSTFLNPQKLTYNKVAIHLGGNNPTSMETKLYSSTEPIRFDYNMSINFGDCYDYSCYGCGTNPTYLGCSQKYGGNYISLEKVNPNSLAGHVTIDDYFTPPPVVYTPFENMATQTPTIGSSSSGGLSDDYLYYPPGNYKLTVRKDMHTTQPVDGELTSISALTNYYGPPIDMVAGGLRIKSKSLYDHNNQKISETKYEYGEGILYDIPKFHQYKNVYNSPANFETHSVSGTYYCVRDLNQSESRIEVSSGFSNILTSSHISYTSVKVSEYNYNQSANKGYTKYYYSERSLFPVTENFSMGIGTIDGAPNNFCSSASPVECDAGLKSFQTTTNIVNVFPPYYKIYDNANLNSVEQYTDTGKILSKKILTYENSFSQGNNINNSVTGLAVSPVLIDYSKEDGCPNVNFALPVSSFHYNNISRYRMNSDQYRLASEKISNYFYNQGNNANIVTTKSDFLYDNTGVNVIKEKITYPEDIITETSYQYAIEKGNQKLITANMIGIPLEALAIKKQNPNDTGKIISKSETKYDDPSNLLPSSVLSYNLQNNNSSNVEVSYDKYDEKGNLQQYTVKGGTPVSIIWGYKNTQPVVKIEGIGYDQLLAAVPSFISDIILASEKDANPIAFNTQPDITESELIKKLDALRKSSRLIDTQITTYTYDPLIGVRSITPPSGVREIYLYDANNRLMEVREQNQTGKLLKEFKYNYKN